MAYPDPVLSPATDFPIMMPKSGGIFYVSPGDNFWTFIFDDGREAHYDFDGHLIP